MKRLLASLLVPVFLAPFSLDSGEQELVLSPGEQRLLAYPGQTSQGIYHTSQPQRPRLYQSTFSYQDASLSQLGHPLSADEPLKIKDFFINNQLVPVFELADGQFLPASQLLVFDDQMMMQEQQSGKFWVKHGALAYDQPYRLGDSPLDKQPKAYDLVSVTELAQTYDGLYYKVDKLGWVSAEDLIPEEERLTVVQDLLDKRYKSEKFSIYVKDLTSQEVAESRADQVMYAASVAKLPILYWAQEQLNQGQLQLDDQLKYTKAVNDYHGAYDTAGAGALSKEADEKSYKVEDLLKALAQSSDNAASNILGYYLTDQNSPAFQEAITDLVGSEWDMRERQLSARTAGIMMEKLYDQGGLVLDYLADTDFDDSRIAKGIDAKVAHKTGDAYELKHDVAIVYGERPFILSIFSDKAEHEDLTKIASDIYKVLK